MLWFEREVKDANTSVWRQGWAVVAANQHWPRAAIERYPSLSEF